MRVERIIDYDYNNGDGVGVSVWTTGCPHKCRGCHNKQLWDKERGMADFEEIMNKVLKAMGDLDVDKHLAILGGEPLAPYNIQGVKEMCRRVKEQFPNKKIWLWTGYTYEDLNSDQIDCLKYVDTLVDGPFIESRKVEGQWYGSDNQRIIELK